MNRYTVFIFNSNYVQGRGKKNLYVVEINTGNEG
jgi:hypothetical protein